MQDMEMSSSLGEKSVEKVGSALTCWFRGCGWFVGDCGGRFGGSRRNGWGTGHSVNCTKAFSIVVRIAFKSHHHFVAAGQHWFRHLFPTEVTWNHQQLLIFNGKQASIGWQGYLLKSKVTHQVWERCHHLNDLRRHLQSQCRSPGPVRRPWMWVEPFLH